MINILNENWIYSYEKPKHFKFVPVIINGKISVARWNSLVNGWFKEGDTEKRVKVTHWLDV